MVRQTTTGSRFWSVAVGWSGRHTLSHDVVCHSFRFLISGKVNEPAGPEHGCAVYGWSVLLPDASLAEVAFELVLMRQERSIVHRTFQPCH